MYDTGDIRFIAQPTLAVAFCIYFVGIQRKARRQYTVEQ